MWLLLAGAICISDPAVFSLSLKQALKIEAAHRGWKFESGEVEGRLFHPVALRHVKLSRAQDSGVVTRLSLGHAKAAFSLGKFLFQRGAKWCKGLDLDELDLEIELPERAAKQAQAKTAATARWSAMPLRLLMPARIEARKVSLIVRQRDATLRFAGMNFSASDLERGTIRINEISARLPWLTKDFRNCEGVLTMDDTSLGISEMTLADGLRVERITTDILNLAGGGLEAELDLTAFDGSIRGLFRGIEPDGSVEISGSFVRIAISELAAFLESNDTSSGTLNEGKFSFRGSPNDLAHATLSTRLVASDFSWGKRRWNSLVLGATMVDRRLQIPEFNLKQADNELTIKGDMTWPRAGVKWWQSDFAFDIAARINNLSELSALLGPGFGDTSGKATIDGAIRGQDRSFSGQLMVAGSRLSYRTAPLDTLQAEIKLNGNELQLTRCEFRHGDDYVRGNGVVNIIGDKRYWAQIKASLQDVALYSAFMEKPLVPVQLAGGLVLDWSGDGTASAHSGAFNAQFRKLRILNEKSSHPVNADLEATYSPGNVFFSKFLVSDDQSYFTSRITVGPRLVNLQSMLLQVGNKAQLDGSALLPIDVWTAWRNASWKGVVDLDGHWDVHLNAKKLDLQKASLLTGRELPVKGEIDGRLDGTGKLNEVDAKGTLVLANAQLPISSSPLEISLQAAQLGVVNQHVGIERIKARLNGSELEASGMLDFRNVRDPVLALNLISGNVAVTAMETLRLEAAIALKISGPLNAANVSGKATLKSAEVLGGLDLVAMLTPGGRNLPPPFALHQRPFGDWTFDVRCSGEHRSLKPDLSIGGTGRAPLMVGQVKFRDQEANSPFATMRITDGAIFFGGETPSVVISGTGRAGEVQFSAAIAGPISQRSVTLLSSPPLSQQEIMSLITRGHTVTPAVELQSDFNLGLPQRAADDQPPL